MMETDDEGAPLPSHDEMLQALADGGRVENSGWPALLDDIIARIERVRLSLSGPVRS
jgi:hypothetical protein